MFLASDPVLSQWSGSTDCNTLYNQRTPNSREYQIARTHSHKVNHLNTRPCITQPPVTPSEGHLIQTANRTKKVTQSSTDRITTSLSPAHEKGKKKSSAQISPNSKLTQTTGPNLGMQKLKERKNLNLKGGKRRPQTQ